MSPYCPIYLSVTGLGHKGLTPVYNRPSHTPIRFAIYTIYIDHPIAKKMLHVVTVGFS